MDNEVFQTQCKAVGECIEALSQTLLEATGGAAAIPKIIAEVLKLIQSFRLLGTHYVSELVKKCRELETKNREVEELSAKLKQSASHTHHAKKPDVNPQVDAEQQKETTIPTDCAKNAEKMPVREHDIAKQPGSHIEMVQILSAKSDELDKTLKGLPRLDGGLDEYREEMFEVQEKVEKMAVNSEFVSRDSDRARHHATRLGESSRGGNGSEAGLGFKKHGSEAGLEFDKQNVDFFQSFNESGPIEQSGNKRRREFIDLVSDSEETNKSSSPPLEHTTREPRTREDVDLKLSNKTKQGTVQEIVAHEQKMVEGLCKTMEHYQHEFWGNLLGSSAYNNVTRVSTLD
ncbi:unnamed protein product [Calypogeia fissa]